jgi:hypothetical protein
MAMARDRTRGAAADPERESIEAEASSADHRLKVPQALGGRDAALGAGEAGPEAWLALRGGLTRSTPGIKVERSASQSTLASWRSQ